VHQGEQDCGDNQFHCIKKKQLKSIQKCSVSVAEAKWTVCLVTLCFLPKDCVKEAVVFCRDRWTRNEMALWYCIVNVRHHFNPQSRVIARSMTTFTYYFGPVRPAQGVVSRWRVIREKFAFGTYGSPSLPSTHTKQQQQQQKRLTYVCRLFSANIIITSQAPSLCPSYLACH
jgi:hypothetical protein